jgi:diaminohydroxyphosphoribosylaminopyrimidine deaminase/5-amino-6-(5-phosphoribosylamino)uracil reductase
VSPTGERFISGFTGEETYEDGGPISLPHAEEIALKKAVSVADLPAWTLYSTLEPCSERSSGREACATRIINSGIRRVVFGAREPYDPVLKIRCRGESFLRAAGVEVVQISEFEAECLRAAKRLRT